jgi:hypothetical protein
MTVEMRGPGAPGCGSGHDLVMRIVREFRVSLLTVMSLLIVIPG